MSKALILIVWMFIGLSCNKNKSMSEKKPETGISENIQTELNDPVCEMPVKDHLVDTTFYQGKIYGFCNKTCKKLFLEDPENYLKKM